jgi:hypothetical protein
MNREQFDIGMRRMERALYQDGSGGSGSGGSRVREKFAELEALRKAIDIQLSRGLDDAGLQAPIVNPVREFTGHELTVHASDGRTYTIDPSRITMRVVRVDGDHVTLGVEVPRSSRIINMTIPVPGEGGIDG